MPFYGTSITRANLQESLGSEDIEKAPIRHKGPDDQLAVAGGQLRRQVYGETG